MKMTKSKLSLLLMMLVLPWMATTANAAQFNITIPIQVSNLPPNIDGMLLFCSVMTGEPRLGGRYIGIGRKRVNITGGAYRGNELISFDVNPGQDPALVTHYECTGTFTGTESGATVHYYNDSIGGSVRFPLTAGAPFRLKTGVLPLPR